MGVWPVVYGFRVQAHPTGDGGITLNWCAGSDWANVERLYALMVAILSQREENRSCFDGLPPWSHRKPFFLDTEFTHTIVELAGPHVQPIKLEPIRTDAEKLQDGTHELYPGLKLDLL